MELLLIRHALPIRVEHDEGGPPADPELSEVGRDQALHLAAWLRDERIDAVFSSPMQRARETAAPLAAAHGLEVVVDDELAEYDRNAHFYVPVEELKATGDPRWKEVLEGTWTDGEVDPATFRAVVVEAVERVIEANPSRRVAVVCHGGVINAYVAHVLDLGDRFETGFFYPVYTSISRVMAARSGERSVASLNETAHLRGTGLHTGMVP
ncbi:MAG: histidine phosphatase family protein [Acidimicrobiales bacterium]|nr:histidine phosphatase family protein [Acidimicrobiales bacterium]